MRPYDIELVSPCHSKPLGITDINEITVEDRNGTFWFTPLCCGDCFSTKEEAEKLLVHYKRMVFKASIRHAKDELQKTINHLTEHLERQIEAFSDDHDPDLQRVYISAVWGKDGHSFVGNFRTSEHETPQDANDDVNKQIKRLQEEGWIVDPTFTPDKDIDHAVKAVVTLRNTHGDKYRQVGYWSHPFITTD